LALAASAPACVPDDAPRGGAEGRPAAVAATPPAAPTGRTVVPTPPQPPREGTPPPSADPALTAPFTDKFDRAELGADWTMTTSAWRLEGGRLCAEHARNHPIWLKRRVPVNARIEFDAISSSEDGDLKAELWGDGRSAADTVSYNDATSYLTIFGGWKNAFHVLARVDEHAPDRPEIRIDDSSSDVRARRVQPNRSYHFKVIRDDGKTVRWYVDDVQMLTYADPRPLSGPGHDHVGFNDWDVHACFDNLNVTPLP
jgi:hypothetical protein